MTSIPSWEWAVGSHLPLLAHSMIRRWSLLALYQYREQALPRISQPPSLRSSTSWVAESGSAPTPAASRPNLGYALCVVRAASASPVRKHMRSRRSTHRCPPHTSTPGRIDCIEPGREPGQMGEEQRHQCGTACDGTPVVCWSCGHDLGEVADDLRCV